MLKKIMYLTFTVFVLSLFTYQNICHAHRFKSNPPFEGHTETIKAWLIAYDDMDAKYKIMTNKHAIFVGAKSAVEKLNSIWSSHQQKLADGNTAIVKNVANTFIALIGAITTKGASTVTYLPTVFATYGAVESVAATRSLEFDLAKYEEALNNSLSDMDAALDALKVNYPPYKQYYDDYLEACANHQITREGEWNKTYTQAEINTAVNKKYLTSGWYHQSESQGTHTIYARGSWSFSDLPYTYNCNSTGTCAVKYRTPYQAYYDHREKCGTDASYSQLVRAYLPDSYTTGNFTFELGIRTVEQGCGQEWYNCDAISHAVHTPRHMIRKCNITILKKGGGSYKCPDSFRKCMYHKRDHDERPLKYGLTEHSETDSSDEEVSSPVQMPTSTPTPSPTPAPTTYHACGVHEDWQSGDHSLQASCSETDSHGQYCTVTNFYACQSHTHVYPPPPTVVAPVWSDIPDPYNLTVGDSFYLDLSSYVTGSPTLSRNGGVIPAGLRNRNGVISGTVTRVESRYFRFTATNSTGSANSEWIKITVTAAQ